MFCSIAFLRFNVSPQFSYSLHNVHPGRYWVFSVEHYSCCFRLTIFCNFVLLCNWIIIFYFIIYYLLLAKKISFYENYLVQRQPPGRKVESKWSTTYIFFERVLLLEDSVSRWGDGSNVNCSNLDDSFDVYVLGSCALEVATFNTQTLRQVRGTVFFLNILWTDAGCSKTHENTKLKSALVSAFQEILGAFLSSMFQLPFPEFAFLAR